MSSPVHGSAYIRKGRQSRGEKQLLKRIGLKLHRELRRSGETTESLSQKVGIARSTIREAVAGRSDLGVLTLRSIVQGLGFPSVRQFMIDIERDPEATGS